MNPFKRKFLFFSLFLIFLITAPLITLYSLGYRLDLKNKKITQTGGIFVKTIPPSAQIFLNGKLSKKTDFLFGSAVIKNLLPRTYKVRVEKDGFFPWEKELEVKEKEVTKTKTIVLFPKNINFQLISDQAEKILPNSKGFLILEKAEGDWALKFYDLERGVKSHLISGREISASTSEPFNFFWNKEKEIFFDLETEKGKKNFSLNFENVPRLSERKIPTSTDLVFSKKIGDDLYELDRFGILRKNNLSLNQNPFPIKPGVNYQIETAFDFVFLLEDGDLFLLDTKTGLFDKIFEGVKGMKISPDKKKLVFFSPFEIWVFYLQEITEPPVKKVGDKVFLNRFSKEIGDLFWLSSDYLVFNLGDEIKAMEIDERDTINLVDLANFKNPQIFFDLGKKKLYILSEKNLYQSQPLF
jgi:hypothetical protein